MSTHKKDFLADPLVAESKETAKLLEKIPSKKDFNTDHNFPGSTSTNAEPTLESNKLNVNIGEKGSPNETDNHSSHPKKSKDTNNTHQDGLANQAEPKSSSTSCKESETDDQWIFLDTVPDFMKCKICSSVFESPQLLSCCGTNICKKCMDRHLQRLAMLADQPPSCPFCRSTDFKLINNTALEQTINQLKVQCCYQHKGCGWTGALGEMEIFISENVSLHPSIVQIGVVVNSLNVADSLITCRFVHVHILPAHLKQLDVMQKCLFSVKQLKSIRVIISVNTYFSLHRRIHSS